MLGDELIALLGDRIPDDHARQWLADRWVPRFYATRPGGARVVDLGCGIGESLDLFRAHDPAVRWVGVDLEDSPEVRERTRGDAEFLTFDGAAIPLPDASVDLVYSKQVFEHVERPRPLLADVARVLRPGGWFCGSLSQMEPYHSLSVGGYTPSGWTTVVEETGLRVVELRPGIDAAALLVRRLLGMPAFADRWFAGTSPLHRVLRRHPRLRGGGPRVHNAARLMVSGQFAFLARRPED